jgi:hypothetical protein
VLPYFRTKAKHASSRAAFMSPVRCLFRLSPPDQAWQLFAAFSRLCKSPPPSHRTPSLSAVLIYSVSPILLDSFVSPPSQPIPPPFLSRRQASTSGIPINHAAATPTLCRLLRLRSHLTPSLSRTESHEALLIEIEGMSRAKSALRKSSEFLLSSIFGTITVRFVWLWIQI